MASEEVDLGSPHEADDEVDALGRGARARLLTTDYLQITDTSALGFFLDRFGDHGSGNVQRCDERRLATATAGPRILIGTPSGIG